MTVGFHREKAAPGSPLAEARMAAHSSFDVLWQSGHMSRSQAYRWLADQLGIKKDDCHMVLFDEGTCHRVRALCDRYIFMEMLEL